MGGGGVEGDATVAEEVSEVVGSAWAGSSRSGCGAGGWGAGGWVATAEATAGATSGATSGLARTGWEAT